MDDGRRIDYWKLHQRIDQLDEDVAVGQNAMVDHLQQMISYFRTTPVK